VEASSLELIAKVVRDESDPFGTHLNTSCFAFSVVEQEQELEPFQVVRHNTKRPSRPRVSNGGTGTLRRSTRIARLYPRRSHRLEDKRSAAKP
jgi:hypothetical protein